MTIDWEAVQAAYPNGVRDTPRPYTLVLAAAHVTLRVDTAEQSTIEIRLADGGSIRACGLTDITFHYRHLADG